MEVKITTKSCLPSGHQMQVRVYYHALSLRYLFSTVMGWILFIRYMLYMIVIYIYSFWQACLYYYNIRYSTLSSNPVIFFD